MKIIVLIDGNSLMYRAYHGVNKGFIPLWEGMPIGMVYGFASTLLHLLEYYRPDQIAVTFDTKEKTFRHEMFEDYKAQREKAPDDFYAQIPYVEEMLESFHIPVLKFPGFESDDIIGTLTKQGEREGWDVKIVSNDLDFLQLVDEHVTLEKLNGSQPISLGVKETMVRYGIEPHQVVDFKALTGDASDNYKGIEGIGPKNASALLQKYKTIEGIYEHLEQLTPKVREKFEQQREAVFQCRELAKLHTDVPVSFEFKANFALHPDTTSAFLEKMKFHSLIGRYQKLNKKFDQKENLAHKSDSEKSASQEQLALF